MRKLRGIPNCWSPDLNKTFFHQKTLTNAPAPKSKNVILDAHFLLLTFTFFDNFKFLKHFTLFNDVQFLTTE